VRVSALVSLGFILTSTGCHGNLAQAPDEHHRELNLPPVGPTVAVNFEGKTVNVELSRVPREQGSNTMALDSLWKTAFPSEDPGPRNRRNLWHVRVISRLY
jgi:hypothetical protein